MRKLPKGISNYEDIVNEDRVYVDKTMYIEKLENLEDKSIMFLRPRKFGKTLFTSVLENYYDKLKTEKFDYLFGKTYIGKNPTVNKNRYCILRFNFSGIDTSSIEMTIKGFKSKTLASIKEFVVKYDLNFFINEQEEAENVLYNLLKAFYIQKPEEKIYVIIDEYDHFANELLGFKTDDFKSLISKNGKVRKWYETLKEGTETAIDRIFITGVAPITIDSLTSGFNISKDITRDEEFNEMTGFNEEELIDLMNEQNITKEEQEKLLPIMKVNYDGYRFGLHAEKRMYNSNMCLYLLSDYIRLGRMPDSLIDTNIASDFSKLSKMLELCHSDRKIEIMEQTLSGDGLISEITEKFNPETSFEDKELISMLYYMGYLTVTGEVLGTPELKIPNKVMKELYSEYFLDCAKRETNITTTTTEYTEIVKELAFEGKINKAIEKLKMYLSNLSNRDYIKFDEKYVKILFYSIVMNFKNAYWIKSEFEVQREYPDLLLIPKERDKGYNAIMIEFKYLKKEESNKLEDKQKEARDQIEEYSKLEEIESIENLNKYAVVAVVDEIYIQKLVGTEWK